jgi:O-methyltransferase involved in polyketide biosynthesis
VNLGLYQDDVLKYFVDIVERKQPLMNLGKTPSHTKATTALSESQGYFSRVSAMRTIIKRFLEAGVNDGDSPAIQNYKQVVSLGAGYDTMIFHLQQQGLDRHLAGYFELDFRPVVTSKISKINSSPVVLNRLKELVTQFESRSESGASSSQRENNEVEFHAGPYHLLTADLRELEHLQTLLVQSGFDPKYVF